MMSCVIGFCMVANIRPIIMQLVYLLCTLYYLQARDSLDNKGIDPEATQRGFLA